MTIWIAMLAGCRDVPVDSDTGKVIHLPNRDSVTTPAITEQRCTSCPESAVRSSQGLCQLMFYYGNDSSAGTNTPTSDSLGVDVTLWWRQATPTANNKMLLSLNMQAQLPESVRQAKTLHWQGRWPKQFQMNIPEMLLQRGATITLKKNPYEGPGLRLDYEVPGTPYYNAETAIITSWPNNVGTFIIEELDSVRRVATGMLKASFVVKDTTTPSCETQIAFQFRLRFGY
ncbi:MAG: hypothetical protein JNJ94_12470 [Chlorobi bacterium]|nr:hypothetical protein [Chlorobiota bacterium]